MENTDKALAVEFFVTAIENKRASREAKRPIYEDREYIRIRFPADNKRELVAPAHEMHYVSHAKRQMTYAQRFEDVYAAWKKQHDNSFVQGTPIHEMTSLTAAKRAELQRMDIKTIEQLAALPSASEKRLGMGAKAIIKDAQLYLERATEHADIAALRRRIEELEAMKQPDSPEMAASEKISDQLDGFGDDELKTMLKDAGVEVDGRWGRSRLEQELQKLADAKENEAA